MEDAIVRPPAIIKNALHITRRKRNRRPTQKWVGAYPSLYDIQEGT